MLPNIQKIVNANCRWQELMNEATAASRIAESFAAVHKSWLEPIRSVRQNISHLAQLQASTKLALQDISLWSNSAKQLMTNIDFAAIKSCFKFDVPVFSMLEKSTIRAIGSYGNLAESLPNISDITQLPDFVLPGATREIFTASLALETLHPREEEADADSQLITKVEQETSGCVPLLQQIAPGLARPYIGARNAFSGKNPDRARHILSSLREMWNHLLHLLAPDNKVIPWVTEVPNHKDLLHEGKPTRRARVLYICRELDNAPLADFVTHDTRALVKMIEVFNRVHELEMGLTEKQLKALLIRTDSWLMYILQITMES